MAAINSSSGSSKWAMLPRELLEMQLGQIDLLMAMYPSVEELVVGDETRAAVEQARQVCEDGTLSTAREGSGQNQVREIYLDLRLALSSDAADALPQAEVERVELEIVVPLGYDCDGVHHDTASPEEPPRIRTRMRQPAWASRTEVALINDDMPQGDDVLSVIEYIHEAASRAYAAAQSLTSSSILTSSGTNRGPNNSSNGDGGGGASALTQAKGSSSSYSPATRDNEMLVRVWFYFPSISTRAKRDDLVRNAPSYGLTGFLLAGKPGLLCLEGGSRAVDEYMRFIKTESWGDIPAHHKKVSERYREESSCACGEEAREEKTIVRRVFGDMVEITDTVGGERRGERANRGDMKAVEAWLTERGLGEAFTKVLI